MFNKTIRTTRKNTSCIVTDIDIPLFGKPRIYLFSGSIGIIVIKNREVLKYISIDNEVNLLYHVVYEEDKTTFVKYEPEAILYKRKKIDL